MDTTVAAMVVDARSRVAGLSPAQVDAHLLAQDVVLVDVREAGERAEDGFIADALHVPRGLLEFWADPRSPSHREELDPERPTIVYCAAGSRSALAADALRALGYREVAHLEGGMEAWMRAGLPVAGLDDWHMTHAR